MRQVRCEVPVVPGGGDQRYMQELDRKTSNKR